MDDKDAFPRQNTLGCHLLELTAICGEFPSALVARLSGGIRYQEAVITSLKKKGLLRTFYGSF